MLLVLACLPSLAGSGCAKRPLVEDSNEPKTQDVTLATNRVELFMEHPYLVRDKEAKFNVHLTVLADGAPVRQGKLTLSARGPGGETVATEQAAPKSRGIYGPVLAFPAAGAWQLVLQLDSDQAKDTVRVPLTVFASSADAAKAAAESEADKPAGLVTFLKEQAWKIGLTHESVRKRRLVERLVVPGEIQAAAGAKALVTPPVAGRLLRPIDGRFPRVGERVQRGQLVGLIEPPLAGPEAVSMQTNRAQLQSLETELDVKLKEAETDVAKAKVDLEHARWAAETLRQAGLQGTIPPKEMRAAQQQLQLAEIGYAGKLKTRDVYEQGKRSVQAFFGDPGRQAALRSVQIPLPAPLTGTVVSAQVTEGDFVGPGRVLFTIIDLDRVWVEAKVSEYDLKRVVAAPAASLSVAAYAGRRFPILGEQGNALIDVGSVVELGSRTVPVRYELGNAEHLLRVGMYADVAIETAHADEALAVPESAIVDEDGRPVAYVQADGEHFQRRDLHLGLRDSGYVEAKHGLKEGERVVTRGAYAIRLASVSAVLPAHGHTH